MKTILKLLAKIIAISFGLASISAGAEPSITALLTPKERADAGINKLTPQERQALDAALLRVFTRVTRSAAAADDLSFFGSDGRAVAFIEANNDTTIYLWSGKPVGYLDENSVYGFNGKHLGWLKDGAIYDHEGELIAASARSFKNPPLAQAPKGLKELKPLKGLKELKPLKPLFGLSWSRTPPAIFFLKGIE